LAETKLMKNAFEVEGKFRKGIITTFRVDGKDTKLSIYKADSLFSSWETALNDEQEYAGKILKFIGTIDDLDHPSGLEKARSFINEERKKITSVLTDVKQFIVYSPENNALRKFEEEGATQPLGIYGEGLFKLLTTMDNEQLSVLKQNLKMIDWFKDFKVLDDQSTGQRRIQLTDRYIDEENMAFFDQRNANEGFLFLLFYISLFVSQYTPKFFAIDNIDNALNPRLCRDLMLRFNTLSQKYKKQVIVTTHNPAILDGINLRDDNQRLYVVFRDLEGATKIKRVTEKMYDYNSKLSLSEAFTRGLIGGLNKSMGTW